jgi:DsbC/DsbD-like thiol-disulfide interchange protein
MLGSIALALACDRPPASAPEAGSRRHETPASMGVPTSGPASVPLLVDQPTPQRPFVAMAALRPAKGHRGDTVELVIEARTAAGWHIYAAEGPRGIGTPTSLDVTLPDGVEPAGAWRYPSSKPGFEGQDAVYEGHLLFRRRLRITEQAKPGPLEIQCQLRYQACDPFRCRPPETLTLSANGAIVPLP